MGRTKYANLLDHDEQDKVVLKDDDCLMSGWWLACDYLRPCWLFAVLTKDGKILFYNERPTPKVQVQPTRIIHVQAETTILSIGDKKFTIKCCLDNHVFGLKDHNERDKWVQAISTIQHQRESHKHQFFVQSNPNNALLLL